MTKLHSYVRKDPDPGMCNPGIPLAIMVLGFATATFYHLGSMILNCHSAYVRLRIVDQLGLDESAAESLVVGCCCSPCSVSGSEIFFFFSLFPP